MGVSGRLWVVAVLSLSLWGCPPTEVPPLADMGLSAPEVTNAEAADRGVWLRAVAEKVAAGDEAGVQAMVDEAPARAIGAATDLGFDILDASLSDPPTPPMIEGGQRVLEALLAALGPRAAGLEGFAARVAGASKANNTLQGGEAAHPAERALHGYLEVSSIEDMSAPGQRERKIALAEACAQDSARAGSVKGVAYCLSAQIVARIEDEALRERGERDIGAMCGLLEGLGDRYEIAACHLIRAYDHLLSGRLEPTIEEARVCRAIIEQEGWTGTRNYENCLALGYNAATARQDLSGAALEFGPPLAELVRARDGAQAALGIDETLTLVAIGALEGMELGREPARVKALARQMAVSGQFAAEGHAAGGRPEIAGIVALRMGRVALDTLTSKDEAVMLARKALEFFKVAGETQDPNGRAARHAARVLLGRALGDQEGVPVLEEAARLAEAQGMIAEAGHARVTLGDKTNVERQKIAVYWQAVQDGRKSGDKRLMTMALARIGHTTKDKKDFGGFLKRAVKVAAEVGPDYEEGFRRQLVDDMMSRKQYRQAVKYADECVSWAANQGRKGDELAFVLAAAGAREKQPGKGGRAEAVAFLERYAAAFGTRGEAALQIKALVELAQVRARGPSPDFEGAERDLRSAAAMLGPSKASAALIREVVQLNLIPMMGRRDFHEAMLKRGLKADEIGSGVVDKVRPMFDRKAIELRDQGALLESALGLMEGTEDKESQALMMMLLASFYERVGRAGEAMGLCQRMLELSAALEAGEGAGPRPNPTREQVIFPMPVNRALECKARLLRSLGRASFDGALRQASLDEAIEILDLARGVSEDSVVGIATSSGAVIKISVPFDEEGYVEMLVEAGHKARALEALERIRNEEMRGHLELKTLALKDEGASKALAEVDALEAREKQTIQAIRQTLQQPVSADKDKALAELNAQLAEGRREFFARLQELEAKYPEYATMVRFTSLDLAGVQKRLPADAVLLEYFPAQDQLYIFVVTPEAFAVERVPIRAEQLFALTERLRALVQTAPQGQLELATRGFKARAVSLEGSAGDQGDVLAISAALHEALIAPVERLAPPGKVLMLVPAGPMNYLPFAALGRPSGGRFRFVAEDYGLAVLPSFKHLDALLSRKGSPTDAGAMMALGNPDGTLPGASTEARAVAALFEGARLLTDAEATRGWFEAQSANSQLIHLATHAVLNPKDPMASFIVLGKGEGAEARLSVRDIYGLQLSGSPLVTLSACNTAMGRENPGAELASLAQAFGIAGAPTILASLWEVPDEATRDLMIAFYTGLRSKPAAEALAAAQRQMIQNPATAHPFYWAAFSLIGHPGAR